MEAILYKVHIVAWHAKIDLDIVCFILILNMTDFHASEVSALVLPSVKASRLELAYINVFTLKGFKYPQICIVIICRVLVIFEIYEQIIYVPKYTYIHIIPVITWFVYK